MIRATYFLSDIDVSFEHSGLQRVSFQWDFIEGRWQVWTDNGVMPVASADRLVRCARAVGLVDPSPECRSAMLALLARDRGELIAAIDLPPSTDSASLGAASVTA